MIALALIAATMAAPSGTAVGISMSEWEVYAGRTKVPVGKVRFNITNNGEDGHDFAVRNRSGRVLLKTPELSSGTQMTARHRFRRAGRFTLFCAIEGHEDAGMKSSFRVVKPAKKRRRR